MSHRLQVLVPTELDLRLGMAAKRNRVSKGEWVRQAIEEKLGRFTEGSTAQDPLARLAALDAPTADIEQMLAEIEAGRK